MNRKTIWDHAGTTYSYPLEIYDDVHSFRKEGRWNRMHAKNAREIS